MAAQRHHGTALIAGLVVLGTLGMIAGCANTMLAPEPWMHWMFWFVAGFIAAHVARRMLLRLDTGTLCVAGVAMILLATGIEKRHFGEPIEASIVIQLALTVAGLLAGAFTARPPDHVRAVFAVLGSGAAGFGAAMLGLAIALLVDREDALWSLLLAIPLGALVTTLWSDVEAVHVALGQALYFALILFAFGTGFEKSTAGLALGAIGAVGGFVLGAIGGAIGAKLRPAPKVEFPEARQLH